MTTKRPLYTGANGKPAEFATTDTLGGVAALRVDATAQEILVWNGLAADPDSLSVAHDGLDAITSGTYNVAVGIHVGTGLTTGAFNQLVGNVVCQGLVSGDKNVVVGYNISGITDKDSNVIIGSDITAGNNDRQILIGHSVVPEGANKTVIGSDGQTDAHIFGTLKIGDGTDATKTATFDCSGIATGTNRTLTLPNASGTLLYAGGPVGTPSSGTLTNCDGLPLTTGITGTLGVANGGTGQTSYTDGQLLIGNSTGNTLAKAALTGTSNQVVVTNGPGSITLSTPQNIATTSTPQFAKMGVGVAASGAASALLCVGGNPATFTSANYMAVVDSTNGGALVLSKDGSNYATLQYSNASGSFVFQTVEATVAYANSMAIKSGCFLLGGTTVPSSATRNLCFEGGATSPVLGATTADIVSAAGIDVAAADRNLYVRNEEGKANRLTGLSCEVATDFTKTSDTTLANITGLTRNVMAGEKYAFRAVLFTTSNVAGGIKFAIAGTATATRMFAYAKVIEASALKTVGTERVTALATTFGDITAVTVANVEIEGEIVVNAAGTLTVQFAQNASNGTGSVVKACSYFELISIGS